MVELMTNRDGVQTVECVMGGGVGWEGVESGEKVEFGGWEGVFLEEI